MPSDATERADLALANATHADDPDGAGWNVRLVRSSDPRVGPNAPLWIWYGVRLLASRLVRLVKRDDRWSVEVLGDGETDWRAARLVSTVTSHDDAVNLGVTTAERIRRGEPLS